MKQTIKTIIRNVKSIKGNTLAEFATTTALMATLLLQLLQSLVKCQKVLKLRNHATKLIRLSNRRSVYQTWLTLKSRTLPGQTKFNAQVGGAAYNNTDASSSGTQLL